MKTSLIETTYPISFREKDAKALGEQIKNRHSVVLIGMKRVGISNFLRFFLHHKDIQKTYMNDGKKHIFIPIDLNDLVEREIYPFWILAFKRILDAAEENKTAPNVRKQIETLFLTSIQSQDLFLTIDSVKKSLTILIQEGFVPTLFFLRFDRMKDALTQEFIYNLQGLITTSNQNISFVFTSVRSFESLAPSFLTKSQVHAFVHNIYIRPAKKVDTQTSYSAINKNYKLHTSESFKSELFRAVDGYAQYLFFSLVSLLERKENLPKPNELFTFLLEDERIGLQSEELWESLNNSEQEVLIKFHKSEKINDTEKQKGEYLFKTGLISEREGMFSPLFASFVQEKIRAEKNDTDKIELTRKEHLFLNFLTSKKNEVCEREQIIESVWPETETLGVSDWAIDRLVARLRSKLKIQETKFEIVTIKTRGYKLIDL